MIDQILGWASKHNSVSTLLLVGSMVTDKNDDLSDYDISVFGHDFGFIEADDWLNEISPFILCIHEKFSWNGIEIPTRLTIFKKLVKVDFAFHPEKLLNHMVKEKVLNATYDNGYEILLDKNGKAKGLPLPTFRAYTVSRPTASAYGQCVREFWFEAYHVAKYLHRQDLWVAQSRDHDMKKWLLSMLQWNAAVKAGFSQRMKPEGKNIRDWISPEFRTRLSGCFSGLEVAEHWKSLRESMSLFETVGKETAALLGYEYPEYISTEIRGLASSENNNS